MRNNQDSVNNSELGPRKARRQQKKKSLKAKFFAIVSVIVILYAIALGAYIASTYFDKDTENDWHNNMQANPIQEVLKPNVPDRTNFLLMGTDEDGTRTDTMMLACYNSVAKDISIVSIPRDTVVTASAAAYEKMREEFPEPGRRAMKINTVHHYGGEKYGNELAVEAVEELLDVDVDYWALVSFDAFEYFIDSIGGVEYNVPIDMYYSDPTQDLLINLKAGVQTLSGEQAEHLMRFRSGYSNADLGRIETQQGFIKEVIRTALRKDTILSNPTAYLNTFFKYVQTDFSITDAVKYLSKIKSEKPETISTYMLPGRAAYVNGFSGYKVDEEEAEALIYDIFKRPVNEAVEGESEMTTEDSSDKTIVILNGGYTSGKAAAAKAELEEHDFPVSGISDWSGEKEYNTRIYVAKETYGQDLKEYFSADPEIIVDEDNEVIEDNDIVVVLGINE